jgi:beta-glucanase (GH16 family)
MKYTLLLSAILVLQTSLLFSCKKEESTPPVVPKLVVEDVSVVEGNSAGKKAIITLDLSEKTTQTITLNWSTEDGTAKAGQDYEAVTNQAVTFLPGDISMTIQVNIISDDILEFKEKFNVILSDLQNVTSAKTSVQVTISDDDTFTPELLDNGYTTPPTYPGMSLVWGDEFDGSALNTSDWNYETGGGGWGNNELEVYTNSADNSFLKDGFLTIKAIKNPYNGDYTSARLTTKGKKEFTYGRIDIRAKMPVGQGMWPALWMLGGNISSAGWPGCGEIDIMEYLGNDPLTVYGTAHYSDGGHQSKGGHYAVTSTQKYNEKFHVFTILWQEGSIDWFVDYHKYFSVSSSTVKFDAFNLPQFFIFNVAVGGAWPGNPDGTTVFPQSMVVDYVRVFQ